MRHLSLMLTTSDTLLWAWRIHIHTNIPTRSCKCLHACTNRPTWVTGRTVVSNEARQTWHGLRGEVPDCMKYICGVDPVVIWVGKENKSVQCVQSSPPGCTAGLLMFLITTYRLPYNNIYMTNTGKKNCMTFPSSGWFHCYSCKQGYKWSEAEWKNIRRRRTCSSLHGMSL